MVSRAKEEGKQLMVVHCIAPWKPDFGGGRACGTDVRFCGTSERFIMLQANVPSIKEKKEEFPANSVIESQERRE